MPEEALSEQAEPGSALQKPSGERGRAQSKSETKANEQNNAEGGELIDSFAEMDSMKFTPEWNSIVGLLFWQLKRTSSQPKEICRLLIRFEMSIYKVSTLL